VEAAVERVSFERMWTGEIVAQGDVVAVGAPLNGWCRCSLWAGGWPGQAAARCAQRG
jgi:hypothetical protein